MGRSALTGPVSVATALILSLFRARRVLVPTIVVAAAMAPVFWRFISEDSPSDHSAHIQFILDGKIPTYPLYHFSVVGLAKCLEIAANRLPNFRDWLELSLNDDALAYKLRLQYSAIVVLTLACTATAALSAGYLASRTSASTFALSVICLGLALAMPLPTTTYLKQLSLPPGRRLPPGYALYLGQITPNVWHNPTTIFAMPFAVALFWVATRAVRDFTLGAAVALAVAAILSLLAKPNYALAVLPVVAIVLASSRCSLDRKISRLLAAFTLPLIVLWGQAAVLVGPYGRATEEMLISPFEVWDRFSQNIPLSAFVGIVFPLSVLLVYHGRFATETPLKLAWVALGTGVFQYSVLIEGGERSTAGNWGWGMMFADHILFLASCDYVLRQRLDARKAICCAAFLVHVGFGIFSLRQCMIDPKWTSVSGLVPVLFS